MVAACPRTKGGSVGLKQKVICSVLRGRKQGEAGRAIHHEHKICMSSKAIGAGAQIAVMPPESDLEMCAVEVKLLGLTIRVFSEHEWLCPVFAKVRKRISPHSRMREGDFSLVPFCA